MTESEPALILVVDDNPGTVASTTRHLREGGFRTIAAATGADALRIAAEADLIILDVRLPDIDGFEVCARLRQDQVTAHTPIIHLSASCVTESAMIQGLEVGGTGYLVHPVEPVVLIATVRAFLRIRAMETKLVHSEAKFRLLFDRALNGIALTGRGLVFTEVNAAMCALLGRERGQIVGRRLEDFMPAAERATGGIDPSGGEWNGAWRGTHIFQRGDGRRIHVELQISSHSGPDTRIILATDVTEQTEAGAKLQAAVRHERDARGEAEKANLLKDEFVAMLSHELRTPLSTISGWAQLLKRRGRDPEQLQKGLDAIERNAKVQLQLISDLLDISRIAAGKMSLDAQVFDIPAAVAAAVATIEGPAELKGTRIRQEVDPRARHMRGDPARIQQVLWNLLSNAVKFTPAGGEITLGVRFTPPFALEITVSDNGQGIAPELLPNVFERFRQEESSTTRTHGGLGLGLAIVKHIVEAHGGSVAARSAGRGHGATFTVTLPTGVENCRAEPVVLADPSLAAVSVDLERKRVLVVEDDSDARDLIATMLERSSATVKTVAGMEEALAALGSFQPHALVSDIAMPRHDGYELIERVRALGFDAARLPAIALTAFGRREDRARALASGYQLQIVKPVDPRDLALALAELLDRHHP
jgi:PAS domain S-box-containing protein